MTNAPADVQGHIKTAIREALDNFVKAYLDDILIYSNSDEEHVEYNKSINDRLWEAGHDLNPENEHSIKKL